MDLQKIFTQLKRIEPDARYAESSRARLLEVAALPKVSGSRPRVILMRFLETGSAIALAGVLVFLIAGGVAVVWGPAAPGFDAAAIRAEAQAVDAQIRLIDLDYSVPQIQGGGESTVADAGGGTPATTTLSSGLEEGVSETEEPTIEEILRALGE